jgi:subtilisin-like proprotein convertase family protein
VKTKILSVLTMVMVLSMIASTVLAAPAPPASQASGAAPDATAAPLFQAADAAGPALYIIQLQEASLASYMGGVAGLAATSPEATGASKLDAASPASKAYLRFLEGQQQEAVNSVESLLGRPVDVTFQYLAVLNAFAATFSPEEAAAIAKLPTVKAVWRDVERQLDTDVGPIHIGAPEIWNGNTPGNVATRGEGVVIGVIDSGINSQHPSFAATDGDGYTHTNPYGAGVYKGWCVANPSFCNAKLAGAYSFNPNGGSPEDTDGHGSHTASTSGGNKHTASFNIGPTAYNLTIHGVAPRANIVAYKVCNPSCPGTASVAAVNSAILNDQVDVLNYSISGSDSPWNDPVDLAFLDASNAGIYVSASAGNSGPGASTVAKTGPWNAAVAASTINRIIANTVDVTGPTTPPALQGMPATPGENTSILANVTGSIKYDPANLNGCVAFSAGFFTNSLALIQRGGCTFDVKVNNAAAAGAIGVVAFNNVGGPPISMGGLTGTPPAFMLDLDDGTALKTFIDSNPTATARVNAATSYLINNDWEDVVAGFSSRGPSQFELVKPDYIAPGVNILAAVAADGANPVQYAFLQGTSMSSPHSAGSAALMVGLYPSWTPAEIKSALASSATGGLVKENGVTPADPFDVGSGLLALGGAANAGLVFNETGANYVAANPAIGGDPKTLNQPSMANYNCATTCSWTRTVKAVVGRTWNVTTSAPAGMTITVTPNSFSLSAGQTQQLTITANVSGLPVNQYAFGSVTLTPNVPRGSAATSIQSLPVVVKPTTAVPDIAVTPASLAATQATNTTTNQNLTIGNVGTAPLTWQIAEAPAAIRLELTPEGMNAPDAPISFIVDDGVGENSIGLTNGGQFLWLNRFTPGAGDFPIQLQQVDVMFEYPGGTSGVNVGELVDIYLYEDADGNPANGAVFKGSLLNQAVEAVNGTTWSTFPLPAAVTFNGPGDILIAVVNRTAGVTAGTFPATIDQTSSQVRSWIGLGTGATTNPPTLPPATFGTVDSFGFAGNMMVRGFGESGGGGPACANPADVPWLSVNPSGGTTNAGGSSNVAVGFNSTGLANGTYNAVLCVTSNDPQTPLVEVPVSLTVEDTSALRVCSMPQLPIPDGNPVGISDTLNVAANEVIADLDVYVNAPHTWVGDLIFTLTHVDSGTTVTLIDRPGYTGSGFGCSGNDYDVTVDDEGPDTPIENQCGATAPAITGDAPGGDPPNTSLLAAFDGESSQGNWTLTVSDNAGGDTGTLMEWCVDVTPAITDDPNIDVDPLSMASTQAPNTTTQQTLDVANTGGEDLSWTIAEEPTSAPELADWSDNFDSYAIGSQLHGQGGWKGWQNDPTAGALTSGDQSRSAPNSAAILGASDLVHEYGETDGQWVYTAWQYVPQNFTGQSYFIMLNSYDDAGSNLNWSTQVMFDGAANLVTNDGGVSGGSAALVKGQWVEIRLEIDLDADTGAFYYNGSQLYSGTWSGQVSGGGATTIAAVDLFANSASVVYYDDMSLVNTSGPTVCSALADIPWVSVAPDNGVTLPGDTTSVDVTFDSTGLAVGVYTGNLCIESDDPDPGPGNETELVVVPLRLQVEGQPPNIDVAPLSLSSTQPANTSTQQALTVGNTGGGMLDWTIAEEDTTAFPAIVPGPQVAQPAAELAGAPAGAAPEAAANSATRWAGPSAVLHDNGPLVTHPGAGAGGADASVLQTNLGLSTYGFGHAVSSGFRVADDFTVPAGPGWMVDSITFFAYQTGSGTTSSINAVNLRIWDGPPGQGGSNIVFGDTSTNRLTGTAFSNIYRSIDTDIANSQRPIMADTAAVNTYLAPGTYWVDWQTGGSLSSGPWAPPVSILGQTGKPGANAVQFDGSAWNPLEDTGALAVQDLPFIVEGTAGQPECVMLTDIPWLSLDSYAGSNAGGSSTALTATFDSTGLAVGTYTGNLCIDSNDPDAGPGNGTELVIVPVELIVEEAPAFSCEYPEEDFEGGVPPLGWSVVNNAGGPTWGNIAACGPNGDGGNWTGGAGDAACISASTLTAGAYDAELRTPVFSLVGYSEATFSYLANYQNFSGIDRLNFDISADGGVTWTTLTSWNSDQGAFQSTPGVFPTVDLADYLGMSNLMLRWHYFWNDPAALGWYAQVDEAEFKCVQGPPTAVTLDGLSAAQAPLPVAGLPLAALPAVVSLALGAVYVLRRKE